MKREKPACCWFTICDTVINSCKLAQHSELQNQLFPHPAVSGITGPLQLVQCNMFSAWQSTSAIACHRICSSLSCFPCVRAVRAGICFS